MSESTVESPLALYSVKTFHDLFLRTEYHSALNLLLDND